MKHREDRSNIASNNSTKHPRSPPSFVHFSHQPSRFPPRLTKMPSKSYADRISNFQNLAAKSLLECIERKKSNLCVSVDVTQKASVLRVVEAVAPYVCLIKVTRSSYLEMVFIY